MTRRLALVGLVLLAAAGCGDGGPTGWRVLFLSDRDGGWALYTMDASGRHQQRVFSAGHADPSGEGIGFGEPVVSPDGRKVLLADRGVTVATLATGARRRIGTGEEAGAAWSSDSTRVAFGGAQGEGLYVADIRTGRRRDLDSPSDVWTPAWSPDGKWIAFAGQDGYGPTGTYVVRADGGGVRQLSEYAPQGQGAYSWSRDGKLAFVGGRNGQEQSRLVVVDARTWRARVLQSRLGDGTVVWSPDGRTIAYTETTGRSGASAIYTIGTDGRHRRRLTPAWPPASYGSPVWSRDGKSLLFVRTPFGGGVQTEIPQVRTMHADGSHERPLTTAFPDGGGNVEPAWVSGPVHTEAAPRPHQVSEGRRIVLRVPFGVDAIAADGSRAAVAPVGYQMGSDTRPTPPMLLWRPGHGDPARVVASSCGAVYQLVLVRGRLAFDCDHAFFDEVAQSMWVVDLRTRIPHDVFFGHGMVFGAGGPGPEGILLDSVVGAGNLLAFGSETDEPHAVRRRTLWRVDGFFGVAVQSSPQAGDVIAAGGGRLAVESPGGRVAIVTAEGAPIRDLPLRIARDRQFVLTGRILLVLQHRDLTAYDTATGKLRWHRRVPAGARLAAADGSLTVYTVGSTVHLLSRTTQKVIQTGARPLRRLRGYVDGLVHAALTANGLFYCFDVADSRYPGRVVFLPRAAL
jgi:Tol biopolymer transport system component